MSIDKAYNKKRSFCKAVLLVIVLPFVLAACDSDNFLTETNPNQIDATNFWSSGEDATANIVGAYSPFAHQFLFARMFYIASNLRSDENFAENLSGDFAQLDVFGTINPAMSPPIHLNLWEGFYRVIFRANTALENVPSIDPDEDMSAQDKEIIMAEARFLRAYSYFWLLVNFKNIPLITEVPAGREEFFPKQADPEEVWQFIFSELEAAKTVLPPEWPDEYLGRATSGAARAVLGRAYLFHYGLMGQNQEDLTKAQAEFEEVITSGRYDLVDDYFDNFELDTEFNEESVFEIPFVHYEGNFSYTPDRYNSQTTFIAGMQYTPDGFGWGGFEPTRRTFNEYTDTTPTGDHDPRRDGTFHYYDPVEYPNDTLYGQAFVDVYADTLDYIGFKKYEASTIPGRDQYRVARAFPPLNFRELRYADVLLMQAEVENELGNTPRAVELINEVRNRAGVTPLTTTFTQPQLKEQIIHERATELAQECKRWYDLLRWGLLEEYIKPMRPEFQSGKHEYLPIPSSEIEVNNNLKQNPGY